MKNVLSHEKLLPGYAFRSSRRRPKAPETVIVSQSDCEAVRCVGSAVIDGLATYLVFKVPGKPIYYFQNRPW